MKLGCVVMAAGASTRFGGNKLFARFGGKTLLRRALECVPAECFDRVCVVCAPGQAARLAESFGFTAVSNDRPELGASFSLRLGLEALGDVDGAMFLVCDQPLLTRESVLALARLFAENPQHIAALGAGGVRGNPCVFPSRLFGELLALTGDTGGSAVIRRHENELLLLEVNERELRDVDYAQELQELL